MDGGDGRDLASDQSRKELSVSLAASSMINATDVLSQEAYQANLKRIQEIKEIVQRLEMNNEVAHKNFLVDQLEKRAKDGREAEVMLTNMRSQPGLSETAQFTNNVPSDRSEVILPTTATLVEVPESHSHLSSSSPAPTPVSHPPQTVQQGHSLKYQWSLPPQPPQVQPYYPDAFRYYTPPPMVHQPPQHNMAPQSRTPVNIGQMGWSTTQNVPPQPIIHYPIAHQSSFQPTRVHQSSQSWSGYPHQVFPLPAADTVPAPGLGRIRTPPGHGGSGTGSSDSSYREPGFPTQTNTSRPLATHNQSHSVPSSAFTSQVQVPLTGISAGLAKSSSGQPHPKLAQSQSQFASTAVPKPVTTSEPRLPYKLPPQLLQHQQQPQPQPQRPPQPPLRSQLYFQQPQPQSQRLLPQPPLPSQQLPQQARAQPPQTHLPLPPQLDNCVPSVQPSQPTTTQEQPWQRGPEPRVDQARFTKLFQTAVQSGAPRLKNFWIHAKASGISDDWFKAAVNSLPPDLWQSVIVQVNQSGATPNTSPPENVPRQEVPGPNTPVVGAPLPPLPPPATIPLVQKTPVTQSATKPSASTEGMLTHSAPVQISGSHTAQLQYCTEQAGKPTLSAQVASIPTPLPRNVPPTQATAMTPDWNVRQVHADVRTPKDANKSTLARDILHSLGRTVPKPHQETRSKATEKANDHESDRLPEVTPSRPVSCVASSKPMAVLPGTNFADAKSPSVPSAKPNVLDVSQRVASPGPSMMKSVLGKEHRQTVVVEGPIMIDLTLEDSDESVCGKGQDSTFPIQTSARAATSSQPVSPANTTNHTPLLESLSLEEPPVDVATDSDNADVRMHSPPLSLAAEKNMDSALLYPPLGGAEPISPSFEQLPREESERPLDGQLPLFLPSPSVSPAHTEPPETDPEIFRDEGEDRPSLKRGSVDVDDTESDAGMVTSRVRKRQKQQVYVLIPPAASHIKKAIKKMRERAMGEGTDSVLEGLGGDEEFQYSHLEQLLIEESKLQLLERQCRWLNCGAILNCGANLLAHLKNHAKEEDLQSPFLCRWVACQREFGMGQERDIHLARHTLRPLPCPFAGCAEQFDKPVEVMQHEVQHQKSDCREPLIRKPTCQPIVPAIPARLGPPPQRLPSHRVIPRRVIKCRISADRHAIVGPWVLWNIFSQVDLSVKKQNASMRGRPTRQSISYDIDSSDPRHDDYDFLTALSSCAPKNPQLDDLDSTLVTMSAARGLTLWGSGSAVSSAAGSATPEEYVNAVVSDAPAVDAAGPSLATDETEEEVGGERQPLPSEEDAVARLLISGL